MDEVSLPDRSFRVGCGPERADASQRCGHAREVRQSYEAALEHGREIRRKLAAARHTFDEASAAADPRRRQEAKDRARAAYNGEHATAETDAGRAEAAARWGRTVDAINRETRIAARAQGQARQAVTALEAELRTAEATERSLHVTTEAAEAACLEARVRLAACEERTLAPQPAAVPTAAGVGASGTSADAPSSGVGAPGAAAAMGGPVPRPVGGMVAPPRGPGPAAVAGASSAGSATRPADRRQRSVRPGPGASGPAQGAGSRGPGPQGAGSQGAGSQRPAPQQWVGQGIPTVIEALLSGDRNWLERIASIVAETVGRPAPAVFAQLRELVDALLATAGSHGFVMLDAAHDFWSRLTAEESRDVLAALARLGFQAEPAEGWHADRAPMQSDLSMALAYAGLDARSLRHLPTNAQLRELPRSISVDARALLVNEAPDLALDHVVRMLGHRADSLGPLWDDWGYIRPILLSDPRTLG